jgi:hypothetical protein
MLTEDERVKSAARQAAGARVEIPLRELATERGVYVMNQRANTRTFAGLNQIGRRRAGVLDDLSGGRPA